MAISFRFLFLCFFLGITPMIKAQKMTEKNRMIVLTDISYFEPDDAQSLVRLLLYSNQIDIEGLIASTNEVRRNQILPEIIEKTIEAYGKVQPNLLKHEAGFPTAKSLLPLIKKGLPLYGMEGVGKGKDSEGSEWILKMLEKKDDRPLWISIWGGSTVLAQALWKIKETRTATEAAQLIKKLRVYAISDQDDSGAWIRKTFPDLFYIVSPGDYLEGTWNAIMKVIPKANNEVISNFWIAENIQQGHGALGAAYPSVVFGVEGDTPAFLYLVNNGLNTPEHPNWGSWGGRYESYIPPFDSTKKLRVPMQPETRPIWTNASDNFTPFVEAKFGRSLVKDTLHFSDHFVSLWRWREEFQYDFAARMDWCTKDFQHANHPPQVGLNSAETFTVKSEERFVLDGTKSTDPDGDALIYHWFYYPEAGTYKGEVKIFPENDMQALSLAPTVQTQQTIHFILKVTDRGTPRLSRYKRVIVTVLPKY
jgi:hypothetical protein